MPEFLQSFLTLSYWFSSYPEPFTGSAYFTMAGVAGGGFVLGAVLKLLARSLRDASNRRILNRLGNLSLTMGVLVAVSFLFTQTSTPLLGNRFWFLLWLLLALVWLGFIARYMVAAAPRERAERAKVEAYQKYLPRAR